MLNKLFYIFIIMMIFQGCSKNAKIEYTYPKNEAQRDAENIGSLMPGGGLYLTKSSEGNK